MTLARFCLFVAAFVLLPSDAAARSFRVDQIPNGSKFGCALCHVSGDGGGARNGFGSQVENTVSGSEDPADWSLIYDLDGDSDGYSNGRELGDLDGLWRPGMAAPAGPAYAPFDRNDSPCGDGVMENPPEECDSDDLPADVTCETFGWGPGELSCSSRCRINQEACQGYERPNNSTPTPTNNATNNATPPDPAETNNDTTGDTTGMTKVENEESGCATIGSSPPLLEAVLFALFAAFRRRR